MFVWEGRVRLRSGQLLKQAGVITSDFNFSPWCRSSLVVGLVLRTLNKTVQSSKNHLIFPNNFCKNSNITFQKSVFWALFYSRYLLFFPECCLLHCGVVICSEVLSNLILFLTVSRVWISFARIMQGFTGSSPLLSWKSVGINSYGKSW